ncbi:MAG: hypothetical protein WB586_22890 [Chthoniobacterales bacterium]
MMRKFLLLFPIVMGLIAAPEPTLADRHMPARVAGHSFSMSRGPARRVIYVDRQGRRSYWKGPRRVYFGPRFFGSPYRAYRRH